MDDGDSADPYYSNPQRFKKPYITTLYTGDTLKVSTIHEVNKCAETVGKIKFSNDSLHLLTEDVGDIQCTAVEFRKFTYTIVKSDIEKYTIVY